MDERIRRLLMEADKLFSDRKNLDSLWQEEALHFFPEMADITSARSVGNEFADHLTTSMPIIARRTLGDSISAMLRPAALDTTSPGVWFSMSIESDKEPDTASQKWLEWATGVQRRAMYDRMAQFTRATKIGDHSFAAFGQTPLSLELNRREAALLYRCHHVRDVAWSEDYAGDIDLIVRKWNPTASQLDQTFGDKAHQKVKTLLKDAPGTRIDCMHVVIRTDNYEQRAPDGTKFNAPWVSIWIDVDNDHVMEEVGSQSRIYIIPRWMPIPDSQYAYSPAVIAALPDARLIQAMTLTLLEASEKYADPPLVGTQEAVRSDVDTRAGGLTWVDYEYDEKLGDALRPLYDVRTGEGLRSAFEMYDRVQAAIGKAFFLDSLSLPPSDVKEMTAFETAQRISEWIRRALPIFEPLIFEYNGQICDETFDHLMREGAFGSVRDMPRQLLGSDIRFKFESPLHESADRRLGQKFLEAKALLVEAAELSRDVVPIVDPMTALRDSIRGIGAPADWTREERDVDQINAQRQQAEEAAMAMAALGGGAETAKNLGSAAKSFADAGATEPAPA